MLIGMLSILSYWLACVAAFMGAGALLRKMMAGGTPDGEDAAETFWRGWCGVSVLLLAVHFFSAISWPVVVVVGGAGAAGCALYVRALARRRVWSAPHAWPFLCGAALYAVWLANRAMGPVGPYDAGLYHLSAVRWARTFPLAPGLVNLHSRLGFNSSYFLLQALLDSACPAWMRHRLAAGMALLVVGLEIGWSAYLAAWRPERTRVSDWFLAGLLAPFAGYCLAHGAGTSPDLIVFLLGVTVGRRLARLLFETNDSGSAFARAGLIVFLCAVGVTVKLSFLAVGGLCAAAALGHVIVWARRESAGWARRAGAAAAPGAAALILWAARGVALTGYPAYPCALGGFDVDWRAPADRARQEVLWVRAWAREPGKKPEEVLGSRRWLSGWVRRVVESPCQRIDVAFPAAAFLVLAALCLARSRERRWPGSGWVWLAPAAGGAGFWFLSAPDPRFAGACLWWLAAGAAALHVMISSPAARPRRIRALLLVSLALAFLRVRGGDLWLSPGSERGFYPVPSPELREARTESGLVVYVPCQGDQCWDGPLPCAPHADPRLRLRRPGSLRWGFRLAPPEDSSAPKESK